MSSPSTEDKIALEIAEVEAITDFASAAPAETVEALGCHVVRIGGASGLLCRALSNSSVLNRVLGVGAGVRPSEDDVDAVLALTQEHRVFVQHAPFAMPVTLLDRWTAAGLVEQSRWTRFCHTLQSFASISTDLAVVSATAEDAPHFGRIVQEAFGLPPATGPWVAALVGRPGWSCVVARQGGDVVAGAAMRVVSHVAWLGFMATTNEARGRGAQSALLGYRLREARERGARLASIETGSPGPDGPGPSFRNILRSGFTIAYERPNLRAPQPTPSASLERAGRAP